MKIKPIGHLVKVGKTKPNKAKVKIGKMNATSLKTMNYEQRTMNDEKNKPKQTQTKPTCSEHACTEHGRSVEPISNWAKFSRLQSCSSAGIIILKNRFSREN